MKQFFKIYKHHLISALVLVSILAIFVPALLKSSADGLEKKMTVALQLPPKPVAPQVAALEPKKAIQTAKISPTGLNDRSQLAQIPQHVQAQSLHAARAEASKHQQYAEVRQQAQTDTGRSKPSKKLVDLAAKRAVFAVQLGLFTVEENARTMVSELKQQGYPARYQKVKRQKGSLYKVMVGALQVREQAEQLKEALADKTKLNGFVVKAEVG